MAKRKRRRIKEFESQVIKHCRKRGILTGSIDTKYRIYSRKLMAAMKAANFYAPGLMALRPDLAERFEDGSVFIWDVKARCMAQHVGQVLLYKTSAETNGRKVRGAGIICFKADHVAEDMAKEVGVRIEKISPEEL